MSNYQVVHIPTYQGSLEDELPKIIFSMDESMKEWPVFRYKYPILPLDVKLWPEAVRRLDMGWRYSMNDMDFRHGYYWSRNLPTISPREFEKWLRA